MNRVLISIMCNVFTGMCSIDMISLFLPIQVLAVYVWCKLQNFISYAMYLIKILLPAQHEKSFHVVQRPGFGAAFAWPRLRCHIVCDYQH